jgi:hypothetical protein
MKKSVFILLAAFLLSCGESKNKPLRIVYKIHYPSGYTTREHTCDCMSYYTKSSRGTNHLVYKKDNGTVFEEHIFVESTSAPIEIISVNGYE